MNYSPRLFMSMALATTAVVVSAQEVNVSGVVTDQTGETVIGASIVEKGSQNATVTDIDGKFTLKVKHGAQLEISYIGYNTLVVPATPDMKITLQRTPSSSTR